MNFFRKQDILQSGNGQLIDIIKKKSLDQMKIIQSGPVCYISAYLNGTKIL